MNNIKKLCIVPGLLLLAAGCNQARDDGTPATTAGAEPASTAPAEVSDPGRAVPAYVRAVHTVRGAGPVSVAIDGTTVMENLALGEASEFIGVHDPKVKIHATRAHQITVAGADGKTLAGPLALDLERGEDITVVVGGAPGRITLTPFEHTNRGSSTRGQAKLAVLHADKALPEVGISLDGKAQPGDIGYGEVTKYFDVAPGKHMLKVHYDKSLIGIVDISRRPGIQSPPSAVRANSIVAMTRPLNLQEGEVYSAILYADATGLPHLRLLEDKFRPALIRAPDAGLQGAT